MLSRELIETAPLTTSLAPPAKWREPPRPVDPAPPDTLMSDPTEPDPDLTITDPPVDSDVLEPAKREISPAAEPEDPEEMSTEPLTPEDTALPTMMLPLEPRSLAPLAIVTAPLTPLAEDPLSRRTDPPNESELDEPPTICTSPPAKLPEDPAVRDIDPPAAPTPLSLTEISTDPEEPDEPTPLRTTTSPPDDPDPLVIDTDPPVLSSTLESPAEITTDAPTLADPDPATTEIPPAEPEVLSEDRTRTEPLPVVDGPLPTVTIPLTPTPEPERTLIIPLPELNDIEEPLDIETSPPEPLNPEPAVTETRPPWAPSPDTTLTSPPATPPPPTPIRMLPDL